MIEGKATVCGVDSQNTRIWQNHGQSMSTLKENVFSSKTGDLG